MPAAPKSPQSKRGTPKAKGAIRAKSGCYTCRIRRKKCDEQQSADTGSCQTCIRLKLECLGFGSKRPEWLREARNVTEVREKIKNFLASQGMIKGHSGNSAPSRSVEPESSQLRLAAEREGSYSDSSSGSPPTPTLSLSEPSSYRHLTSSARDEPLSSWHPSPYHQSGEFSDSIIYVSPYSCSAGLYPTGLQRDASPYSQDHDQYNFQSSDNTLVPASFNPAIRSTFSGLYHWEPTQEDIGFSEFWIGQPTAGLVFHQQPDFYFPTSMLKEFLHDYMSHVVHAQYLLVGNDVPSMIYQTVHRNQRTAQAVEILASVYYRRMQNPKRQAIEYSELNERLQPLLTLLNKNQRLIAEDAMAALHIVSSFLFDGGQGSWREWLTAASRYVRGLLNDTRYASATDALCRCSKQDAFIIKTTIWFDVLAAITTGENPAFLDSIREMFDPSASRIVDPSCESQFSMMSPMGCENRVVWALAETSCLAAWKTQQEADGCLSISALVSHAERIDAHLERPSYQMQPASTLEGRCQLASEVFRSSTRLYLRSVVSGDYPQVPEIASSVQDVIQCIQRVNRDTQFSGEGAASRSVVRNTVFGLFIAGAFANRGQGREVIQGELMREANSFGNCGSILDLLTGLWEQRDRSQMKGPVPWRSELSRTSTLLV